MAENEPLENTKEKYKIYEEKDSPSSPPEHPSLTGNPTSQIVAQFKEFPKRQYSTYIENYSFYEQRKAPIPSYGVVLYTIKDEQIYFLLSQQRDTIEYIEYLRGRYTADNIHFFLTLMTTIERRRLVTHSFDELWNDLWINKSHKIYREEYPKAKAKFEENAAYLPHLLSETRTFLTEPHWGFPKGKKNENEDNLSCALREFSEETCMKLDNYSLVRNTTFNEFYIGSDKKLYSTHYFICETNEKIPIVKMTGIDAIRTESVSDEIGELMWLTLDEASQKLSYKRRTLLMSIQKYIIKRRMGVFYDRYSNASRSCV